jgi:outer membrane lipoprotein carrier protein
MALEKCLHLHRLRLINTTRDISLMPIKCHALASFLLLSLISCSLSWNLLANETIASKPSQPTAADELKALLVNFDSFQANFSQEVLTDTSNRFDKTEGEFVLKRPNRFRWHVQKPYEQLIIADGKSLYSIDNDLEQVTIADLEQSLVNSPVQILSKADAELDKVFEIQAVRPEDDEMRDPSRQAFILKPKDNSATFEYIFLDFNDKVLTSIELADSLGQITMVSLFNIRVNPILGNDSFNYQIIEGFDVIDTRETN